MKMKFIIPAVAAGALILSGDNSAVANPTSVTVDTVTGAKYNHTKLISTYGNQIPGSVLGAPYKTDYCYYFLSDGSIRTMVESGVCVDYTAGYSLGNEASRKPVNPIDTFYVNKDLLFESTSIEVKVPAGDIYQIFGLKVVQLDTVIDVFIDGKRVASLSSKGARFGEDQLLGSIDVPRGSSGRIKFVNTRYGQGGIGHLTNEPAVNSSAKLTKRTPKTNKLNSAIDFKTFNVPGSRNLHGYTLRDLRTFTKDRPAEINTIKNLLGLNKSLNLTALDNQINKANSKKSSDLTRLTMNYNIAQNSRLYNASKVKGLEDELSYARHLSSGKYTRAAGIRLITAPGSIRSASERVRGSVTVLNNSTPIKSGTVRIAISESSGKITLLNAKIGSDGKATFTIPRGKSGLVTVTPYVMSGGKIVTGATEQYLFN